MKRGYCASDVIGFHYAAGADLKVFRNCSRWKYRTTRVCKQIQPVFLWVKGVCICKRTRWLKVMQIHEQTGASVVCTSFLFNGRFWLDMSRINQVMEVWMLLVAKTQKYQITHSFTAKLHQSLKTMQSTQSTGCCFHDKKSPFVLCTATQRGSGMGNGRNGMVQKTCS